MNIFNNLKDFWPKKWPSKRQLVRLPEILTKREKITLLSLFLVMIFSFFYGSLSLYYSSTQVVPATGGAYREGFIKSSRMILINPLYASQSEAENDIIEVVFEGLMRYDKEGNLIANLAKGYDTQDNKNFKVTLKEDLFWSDGEPMTAEDIVFTVKTIQNREFQSTLRQRWDGVEVEKISSHEVLFSLEESSSIFPENLTLKIIPKHVFDEHSPRDFRYSIHNMQPIGSGPYRFKEAKEGASGDIEHIKLERNPHYFGSKPYLDEVSFYFFRNLDEMLRAQRRGEIDGFALPDGLGEYIESEEIRGFDHYSISLPRFYSLFFNLRLENATAQRDVRKALDYATNKEELVEVVLGGRGHKVNSPILSSFYGIDNPENVRSYNTQKAKEILKEAGFINGEKETQDPFTFKEDLKEESQGEEVRNLQRCFLYLAEDDEDLYPQGEVTGFFDEDTKEAVVYFQEKYREEILDPGGFSSGTGMVSDGTRKKLNELCEDLFYESISLEISITVLDNPLLIKTAQTLKNQWAKIGVDVKIEEKDVTDFQEEAIRLREFESLLFGTMLTAKINPFPLWHSTRIDDPGINLSGYENEELDELLEKVISSNGKENDDALLEIQEIILEDVPAIFLYNPNYNYYISNRIKGTEERNLFYSSQRFEDIEKWYINTKRVIKR